MNRGVEAPSARDALAAARACAGGDLSADDNEDNGTGPGPGALCGR